MCLREGVRAEATGDCCEQGGLRVEVEIDCALGYAASRATSSMDVRLTPYRRKRLSAASRIRIRFSLLSAAASRVVREGFSRADEDF